MQHGLVLHLMTRNVMKTFTKRFKDALITYEIELVEIMSGIAAIAWGVWLINPTLHTFQSSDTFATMRLIAPEWIWGVVMILVGFLQVESVLSHKISRRKHTSFMLAVMWIFITALFAHANIASTGIAIYGVFATATVWGYLRLSQRVELTSRFSDKSNHFTQKLKH